MALSTLERSRSAAAGVEFALVCLPFLGLLLGTVSVALNLYLQFALDYSLQQAVRQIQLGHVPPSTSAGDFVSKVFCPVLTQFAACTGLVASVQPVTDYGSLSVVANSGPLSAFCVGQPGQLMYARVTYQTPFLGGLYTTANGNTLIAAAAFANENPSGTPATGPAGC